jgi:anti-sigma factor RsiW
MTEHIASDRDLLLHAYLDGELAPAEALAMERELASDAALAARLARLTALRTRIAKGLPPVAVPPALAARITSALGLREQPAAPGRAIGEWRRLAAAIVLAAGVGSGATFFALQAPDPVPTAVAASHIRALMAAQPTDVSSSDRHTVKPWFAGRIPQAPQVVDLTRDGFPLVGGRVDVIGTTPVPTLAYRHRQHLISLTAVPARGLAASAGQRTIDGYHLLAWSEDGVTYWAVSDLGPADLENFARAFRAAAREG